MLAGNVSDLSRTRREGGEAFVVCEREVGGRECVCVCKRECKICFFVIMQASKG